MLELQNVTKIYRTKGKDVVALNGVSLCFEEKGMVFITGKSGSGKTTMLNVIGGLDNFDSGKLIVKGKSFDSFKQKDFDSYRNSFIGFVFQEYNLLDEMTVEKNISLAMELQGQRKRDVKSINALLKRVDLEGLNNRRPAELSGGQKQRVAIARALVKKPQVILTDEPTGALDTQSGIQVMDLLKELSRERLVIIVSHNLELANDYADRIIQMKDGSIEKDYQILRDAAKQKEDVRINNDKVYVRRGAKLSAADVKTLIGGIENSKDVQVVDGQAFSVEKPTEVVCKKYADGDCKFIKGRLGIVNNLKLGINSLRIKPLRLVVTILLCAIAFSVFGLFDTMAIYDQGRLTANTLKNSNVPSLVLSAAIGDKDNSINFSQQLVDDVNAETGLKFKGVFKTGSMKPTEISRIAFISQYYVSAFFNGFVEMVQDEFNDYGLTMLCGRMPNAYDELAISKYYAQCIINWGYVSKNNSFVISANNFQNIKIEDLVREGDYLTLTINGKLYKIVGIVDAGEIDSKYDSLIENYANAEKTLITEYENYILNSLQMYAFVKHGFADNYYVEAKNLPAFKAIDNTYKFDFEPNEKFAEFYSFDDLNKFENAVYYFEGDKNDLESNEILLNVYAFERIYAEALDGGFGIDRFKRLVNNSINQGSDRYQGYIDKLDGYLNEIKTSKTTGEEKIAALKSAIELINEVCRTDSNDIIRTTKVTKYDTTQYDPNNSGELLSVPLENNEYKIVGFYTTGKAVAAGAKTSFVLTLSGLSNLGVNTLQGGYADLIAPSTQDVNKINAVVKLVTRSEGITFSCSNNVIKIIDVNKDFLDKMSMLFLIASAIFAVFAISMMANYIATSINNKHTEIGILRALGSSGAGVLKMFLTESIFIALINIVLSNVLTAVCCIFINSFLKNIMNISITLASYTLRQFGIICGLSLAVAVIASIIPIVKLSRQKPIEAIRRN